MRRSAFVVALASALMLMVMAAAPGTVRRFGAKDLVWGYGLQTQPSRLTSGTITSPKMSPINVLARGVTNAGATDCVDSLNVVIAEVSAAGGGAIYCPAGTYLLGSVDTGDIKQSGSAGSIIQLKPNVSIYGDGPATVFKIKDALGNFESIFHQDNPTTAALDNVVYRDFTIDYNASGNAVSDGFENDNNSRFGFLVMDGDNITIENIRVVDGDCVNTFMFNGNYYSGNNLTNVAVRGCSFINTGSATDDYDHSTLYFQGCDGISVVGNYFSAAALTDYGAAAAVETHGGYQVVSGNIVLNYATMFNITGISENDNDNSSVSGNTGAGLSYGIRIYSRFTADNATGYGLKGVAVTGNTINIAQFSRQSGKATTLNYGIGVVGYATLQAPIYDLAITGNTITFESESSASATPVLASGVAFYNSGTSNAMSINNVSVSGNAIAYAPGPGIWLQCEMNGVSIQGNIITNPGQTQNASTDSGYKAGIYCNAESTRDLYIGNNVILDNLTTGRMVWGMELIFDELPYNVTVMNNKITKRQGSLTARQQIYAQAPAKPLVVHSGAGTPLNGVRAGIGSVWYRTDGGAGYATYFKETETDTTGWNRRQYFSGAYADSIYERTAAAGVKIDGVHAKDSILRATSARLDSLTMKTALHGVVIDPILPINTSARAADDSLGIAENVIHFSGQSGNVFCTLPTYATVPVGKVYTIINCDATATDSVFVEANGAEFLNGLATRRAVGLRGYDAATGYFRAKIMYVSATVGWARID